MQTKTVRQPGMLSHTVLAQKLCIQELEKALKVSELKNAELSQELSSYKQRSPYLLNGPCLPLESWDRQTPGVEQQILSSNNQYELNDKIAQLIADGWTKDGDVSVENGELSVVMSKRTLGGSYAG